MNDDTASFAWTDLPSEFIHRLPDFLCDHDLDAYRAFTENVSPLSVRLTNNRMTRSEVLKHLEDSGLKADPVDWMPDAIHLDPRDRRRIQETKLHSEGDLLIQSLSSMAAVETLDVRPGHDVLDCCAAPGGKTALIRFRQLNQGILVANDLSKKRIFKMKRLFKHIKVEGVDINIQAAETLGGSHAGCFDRVLLDAPCSGEGRFHVDSPSTWHDWEPGKVRRLAKLQQRLLRAALQTLRPGGVLIYSTCTLSPEENELVVSTILEDAPVPVTLVPIELECPGQRPGLAQWMGRSMDDGLRMTVRIIPERGMTPFFMAKLMRTA